MKTILVALSCSLTIAALAQDAEIAIAPAIEIGVMAETGRVYQIERVASLPGATNWQPVGQTYLGEAEAPLHWYFPIGDDRSAMYRLVERPAVPEDYAKFFATVHSDGRGTMIELSLEALRDEMAQLALYNPLKAFTRGVTYPTTDARGREQFVSGSIVAPGVTNETSFSIICYQHPTQVVRRHSPSHFCVFDDQISWEVATLMSAAGFIVLSADYPGMGVNLDPHPYCHLSLGNSIVDLISIATNLLDELDTQVRWNGRVYLVGYSEGGYATMAAARSMQEDHPGRFDVRIVYSLDAPHSLSDTMRDVMLHADAEYNAPYFLPFFIAGYEDLYADTIPEFAFDSCILTNYAGDSDFARRLKRRLNGNYLSGDINSLIMRPGYYEGPRSILTDELIGFLEDPDSAVCQTLRSNNTYVGWVPDMQVRLVHNTYDDLVPVGNTTNFIHYLETTLGSVPANIQTLYYPWYVPGMGSVHGGAFPVAILLAFTDLCIQDRLN